MAGRIRAEDITRLRERVDVVELVGAYTSLRPAGAGRFKGLCPFHSERTPSFTVDAERRLYHCFGCDAGGDLYAFVQAVETLSFPEAVEWVARFAGYELTYEELSPGQRQALGRRTRIAEVLREAFAFHAAQLAGPDGTAAREYLTTRGLDDEALSRFGIGWAPDAWDALSRHLLAKGFEARELEAAGVATAGRRGPVDRLRGRVLFPITDPTGRDVLAFGGRVLPGATLDTWRGDGAPPKYMNTPETEVYKKSRVLYGLAWARGAVQREGVAVVVEGYLDVIGLHLAGAPLAVATCGTALTADHFRLLERYTPRVVLALDADEAGWAAAERARALAEEAGVRHVGVLPLPAGQDPADLAADGERAVRDALAATVSATEFQIAQVLRAADTTSPEGQIAAYRATFPLLQALEDRALRYRYIRDVVAPAVRLNADRIEAELDQAPPLPPAAPPTSPSGPRPRSSPGDVSAATARDPQLRLERLVLQAALQLPHLLPSVWSTVQPRDFRAPASQELLRALRAAEDAGAASLDEVLAHLPSDDLRRRVRRLALDEPMIPAEEAAVAEAVRDLLVAAMNREREDVRQELGLLNASVDAERVRSLQRRHADLEDRRRALLAP